ncbi:MAG: TIR domain-containing protein [Acidobacteria bacterium]|nr:TIR domain-containing protein [Acidobacteriota bacterium]
MASPPQFEDDIFISYAHIDNQPLAEGLEGWIATLHERLRIRLEQLTGERVRLWRDPKLQGNDVFAETLIARLSKSALLVAVISPRYVKSEWCLRELSEFCRRAESYGGLTLGDRSRVFKVVKFNVPLQEHPPQLQGMLGYEFYEYDAARDRAREFSPDVLPARDIRYWEKLDDLAYDIKGMIETMRRAGDAPALAPTLPPAGGPSKTVYLAETTSDLGAERDLIKRELQQRGHVVLPDRELPLRGGALREAVREYLGRSELSVHLLGAHYGIIPEDEGRSLAEIQSELAGACGEGLRRIVWMPVGLEARDERQREFVNGLCLGLTLNGHGKAEVLQTSLEDLKQLIGERVADQPKLSATLLDGDPEGGGGPANVYLICDREDIDDVRPVEDCLFEQGLNVVTSAVEGDEAALREDHRANLIECDAVMTYYGRANDIWLRMKQRELQKVAGYGRTKPLLAKAIYITGPATPSKERVRDQESLVIRNFDRFSPDCLRPFVERVTSGKGARG